MFTLTIAGADHCYGNKCHYGSCNPLSEGYECQCNHGYKGKYCQGKQTNNVKLSLNINTDYYKSMLWTEILIPKFDVIFTICSEIDYCYEHECDHGDCKALESGYECQCKNGFTGKYCRGKYDWR